MNNYLKFRQICAALLLMPRWKKNAVVLMLDILICIFSIWLSLSLLAGKIFSISSHFLILSLISVTLFIPLLIIFKSYKVVFRFSGLKNFTSIIKATFIYSVLFYFVSTWLGVIKISGSLFLIQPILLCISIISLRITIRYLVGDWSFYGIRNKNNLTGILIYGAGEAGRQIASVLLQNKACNVLGFLDDAVQLQGQSVNGITVYNPQTLKTLAKEFNISEVLIAVPSATRDQRLRIINGLAKANLPVRSLPGILDIATGKVGVSDLQELNVDDLLGRERVQSDDFLMKKNIAGKVVLVTGAGGSIGSEICRQALKLNASNLVMLDQSEFALYSIYQELSNKIYKHSHPETKLIPLLGSVCNDNLIKSILTAWQPFTIFHAAAFKHVPMVEHNVVESINNNVFGTLAIAKLAASHSVSNFILVSTDKAVRPTNIMGATKRLAEMIIQALNEQPSNTKFSMVRFGNVLESSGSVVPIFRKQIQDRLPITLTHLDVTRYFMTIPEAAELVIQAGAMARGGDVFILDMGSPVKIKDLAVRMVELSGLTIKNESNPGGDILIKIIGLRAGEKLYEELLIGNNPESTSHPRILKSNEAFVSNDVLSEKLLLLKSACEIRDLKLVKEILHRVVDGYNSNSEIVDWTYKKLK